MLLRSLDSSFDILALMIQERPDFKTLDPSDILERLNTHEFQLSEKRDIYGPNYGRTRALKAKAVSSSEEESDSSSDDPEDIGRELAMLVKKFQKFTKKKGFRKSSRSSSRNDEAPAHDYKRKTCHKCKKLGHFISECPQWDNENKKKKKSKEYDFEEDLEEDFEYFFFFLSSESYSLLFFFFLFSLSHCGHSEMKWPGFLHL